MELCIFWLCSTFYIFCTYFPTFACTSVSFLHLAANFALIITSFSPVRTAWFFSYSFAFSTTKMHFQVDPSFRIPVDRKQDVSWEISASNWKMLTGMKFKFQRAGLESWELIFCHSCTTWKAVCGLRAGQWPPLQSLVFCSCCQGCSFSHVTSALPQSTYLQRGLNNNSSLDEEVYILFLRCWHPPEVSAAKSLKLGTVK